MTKQQKIGAVILISLLLLGIVFRFYNPIIALIFLVSVVLAVYVEANKNSRPSASTQAPRRKSSLNQRRAEYEQELAERMKSKGMAPKTSQKPSPSVPKRDISVAKFRQLTKMVNGQEDVARRLIENNLKLFPDKSTDWACEKAITDLERDRRA